MKEELINYITGDCSDSDAKRVRGWINFSEENKQEFFRLKSIYAFSKTTSKRLDVDAEYKSVFKNLGIRKLHMLRIYRSTIRYAAIIVLALMVGYTASQLQFFNGGGNKQVALNEIIVPPGQISEFVLSDGTHAWLNSGTTIKFPSMFDQTNREIFLEGEAYFKVTSNKKKPFLVRSGDLTTKVVGTEFNVSAYAESQTIETTLIKGAVEILGYSDEKIVGLSPGQQFYYTKTTGRYTLNKIDTEPFEAWKEGVLIFRDQSLKEVSSKLERWYNIEISFGDNLVGDYKFSGTLLKEKPFDQILQAIKLTLPISYEIEVKHQEKNKITLYSMKPK